MGFGMIALAMMGAMLGAMASAQPADGAPPVMVNMVQPSAIEGAPLRQPTGEGYLCAAGYGDCVRIVSSEDGSAQLGVFDMDAAAADMATVALPVQPNSEERQEIDVWNRAIRLPDAPDATAGERSYLIGIIRETLVAFSGGGASGRRLHLFRLTIGAGTAQLGPEMLSLPWASDALIRACFSEQDQRNRRGECHDTYRFMPSMMLDAERDGAYPALTYRTIATAFPRTARRSEDSSAAPPLTAADLTDWRDPECSYTRTLHYNPASERYEMDRPAPDCSSYTLP